ncbi:HD-domain/PDEase-like protein [Imleria badia]|nr:HD-domain/PDEase-like protein [Imleria badia]
MARATGFSGNLYSRRLQETGCLLVPRRGRTGRCDDASSWARIVHVMNNSITLPLTMTESVSTRTRLLQTRYFKDSVHDYVSFSPWICSFIDTKHFQRLRYIKQLGLTYHVFPSAAHNRFEHCLGVGYLARLMATHLRDMDASLGITDQHIECVELAGLCHDLGHGPWSHVWDGVFIPAALPNTKWKHERASEMMFDDMVETYQLDITPEEATIVKALIAGEKERCPLGNTMPFLFEIVANERNGLDVDKFDYIMRDCHAVGDRGNISISRLIHSSRVVEGKICYDIKDANQIYELFYTRFSLHKRIYNHKTTKAIEYMVIDALLEAEPYLKIAQHVENPKRYVFLTDNLINQIEESTVPELESARAIVERIRTRDLYKVVDYKVFSHADKDMIKANVTPEEIVKVATSGVLTGVDQELVAQLKPSHVIVTCSLMHYGKGEHNPLDEVTFYSKKKPHECAKADFSDISLLMPSSFAEVWLRVYTKDGTFHGLIQAAYRHILKNLVSSEPQGVTAPTEEAEEEGFNPGDLAGPAAAEGDVDLVPITVFQPGTPSPGQSRPATPRMFGRNLSTASIGSASGGGRSRQMGRVSSFSENQFTAVAPNFRGESPSRKPKSKRGRDVSDSLEDERPRKSARIADKERIPLHGIR